jgi:hypothetical protein
MNAESEMITSLIVTGGNAHDGKQFPMLVEKDGGQGRPIDTYAADRGYDEVSIFARHGATGFRLSWSTRRDDAAYETPVDG